MRSNQPLCAEAVRDCTLVLGTGTLTHRKAEQPVVRLDKLAPLVERSPRTAADKSRSSSGRKSTD